MLLVANVEVIIDLLLLSLSQMRVVELTLEFSLPHLDFLVLLLHQRDQLLVLVNKVVVLGQ